MKKSLTIGLAAAAGAAAVALLVSVGVSAGPLGDTDTRADNGATQTLPAHEIAASVRAAGLDPNGTPALRGRYYALDAIDRHGAEMRVLADAQAGDILSIAPARRGDAFRMAYSSGPRIIHIPQPDDDIPTGDYRANANGDDARHVDDVADPEPPNPVRRTRPAKRHRSAAPPPIERHIVNSAPPPPPQAAADDKDQALTPVYPTPDFGAKIGSDEKFAPLPRQN